jgi:hypothetical protein
LACAESSNLTARKEIGAGSDPGTVNPSMKFYLFG